MTLAAIVDTGPLVAFLDRGQRHHRWVVEHVSELRALHRKYRDRPMSHADSCIVRTAELNARHAVFTLDAGFTIDRKHGGEPLDVIHPAA